MLRKVYIRTDRWSEMIESIIPFPTRKAVLLWLLPQYIVKAEKSDFTTSSVLIFGDHFLKRVMVQEPAFKAFVTKLMAIREDRSAIDALSLIVKFYPMEELLPLVTSLVQEEPDAMGEWHIANSTLPGRSRGEVLHKFLKPVQFTGRFQRHRDRPSLIHFRKECFSSWTAEQQHTYAESLIEELRNKTNRSMWAKRSLLELLCALPSYESDQLFATFATEDKYDDNFVIKSFMENMRHMRDEASLQELLRICQEGKRGAEAAGRALRCRLRHYSSEAVLQRTKPLLTSSDVSIPFQISFLRILSDIRCEEGFQAMCTYYDQHENTQEEDDDDRLHLAYVKELTNHLDKEEAWRRLEKEVEKADSHAVLCQLCGVANEKLTDAASITRYDQSILRRILGHPIAEEERKVRIAVVRRYLGFKGKESTIFPELQTVCFNALEDRKSKLQLLSFRLLLSYDEIDIPTTAAAVLAVKNDLSLRALLLPLLNTTDHTPLYRRNALALSEALYRGMIAAGRQIGLAFRLLFIGSSRKWTAEEQKLLQNGVLHVRRYAEWVDALQKECHSNPCRSREELWSVENVCRKEEKDVLLQQTGLTLVEVLAEKWGYGEEERKAIQFYRGLQQNPWTRDAALLVQLPGE
ncbi:hypothetical protein AGDE_16935 [Angomonas deanei]|uniref:Uncharacterized protein n=1 Tax=Angomonas deanei TaxID=59799 RepID=A0A7G2C3P1_9TRYP|nr:hypothetical protein AGDE_16935 [Angomonas deanei]CAD2213761.1 hypothetical protein, conserved [Angomonas deanei]|eukprot:EPY15859.1 hypothetical protein AGDE_16935 [Angomonas deanei]